VGVLLVKVVGGVLVKFLKNYLQSYKATLCSGVMIGIVSVHTLEDVLLMSIGRFLPVPLLAMYGLGLILSWLLMGCIVNWFLKRVGVTTHNH
jgi:hypothetical protein